MCKREIKFYESSIREHSCSSITQKKGRGKKKTFIPSPLLTHSGLLPLFFVAKEPPRFVKEKLKYCATVSHSCAKVVRQLLQISFSTRSAARNSTATTILLSSASNVRVVSDIWKELNCYFRQWKCAQMIRELD